MNKYTAFLLTLLVSLSACGASTPPAATGEKINVVASFYPYAYFAERVGGDAATVTSIVSPGIEPHDFEPRPQDMVALTKSKLFFFNGGGIEPWADKLYENLRSQQIVPLRMTDYVSLSNSDPHIWLDPVLAQKIADVMVEAYVKVDPSHESLYRSNGTILIDELKKLDTLFKSGLATCEKRDIISAHDAFGYLGRRYQLTMHSIAGVSPGAEPAPRELSALADLVTKLGIEYIFFEDLVSPKLAQTLATEAHVKSAVLHPIEGLTQEQLSSGKNYFTEMNDNLIALRTALKCK